ncbi:MAG TPA: energy transducer TonB [Chthoniobacterales bacterium]|nr:energy transducer TonB [Chthoniobacterales bacterium]
MLGRILVIAWLTCVILPAALAADQTTAVWSDGHISPLSDEELTRYATASPGAGYPEEAQKTNATGSGLYELRIDKGGKVTVVAIVKSSGNAVLDKAATTTFRKWRFKPAVFRSVRIPVSWSVNKVRK